MAKKKVKKIPNMDPEISSYHQKINYKVVEDIKPDKLKPNEIFEGLNKKKDNKQSKRKNKGTNKKTVKSKY